MKISEARVIVTCPGRNFVTLKICTEDGIYGLAHRSPGMQPAAVFAFASAEDRVGCVAEVAWRDLPAEHGTVER